MFFLLAKKLFWSVSFQSIIMKVHTFTYLTIYHNFTLETNIRFFTCLIYPEDLGLILRHFFVWNKKLDTDFTKKL